MGDVRLECTDLQWNKKSTVFVPVSYLQTPILEWVTDTKV